jgi:uncharacterized protein YecT (DUF1311 family)
MSAFKTLSAALLIACAPYAASAQDAGLSKPYAACMDKSGGTTMSMIECITAETQRQDARLNKAYKAVMAELPPERKKQLLEAQRAWIKFRDANCSFYNDPDGGTLAPVNANDCMLTSTAARVHELESFKQ